jgi:hypothetical protein
MRAPRYRWEPYTEYEALPLKESRQQYGAWDMSGRQSGIEKAFAVMTSV